MSAEAGTSASVSHGARGLQTPAGRAGRDDWNDVVDRGGAATGAGGPRIRRAPPPRSAERATWPTPSTGWACCSSTSSTSWSVALPGAVLAARPVPARARSRGVSAADFTEAWAHEASIVPMATWPLLRDRRETHIARPWGFDESWRHHEYVETAIGEIARRGPLAPAICPTPRTPAGACRIVVRHRAARRPRGLFRARPTGRDGAPRQLLARVRPRRARHPGAAPRPRVERTRPSASSDDAARGCGVGTAADLADYFRMKAGRCGRAWRNWSTPALGAVRVDGGGNPRTLPLPEWPPRRQSTHGRCSRRSIRDLVPAPDVRCSGSTTVSRFRPRGERKWGSYVLPFLLGDRLVARVDAVGPAARTACSCPARGWRTES